MARSLPSKLLKIRPPIHSSDFRRIVVVKDLYFSFELAYFSFRQLFDRRIWSASQRQIFLQQIFFSGYQSVPLIMTLSFILGNLFVFVCLSFMMAQLEFTLPIMKTLLIREVSPLLISILVIARSGTAVATEIGDMRANLEISALESMGIQPLRFVILPRILSGVLSCTILHIFFCLLVLIFGSGAFVLGSEKTLVFYFSQTLLHLSGEEFWISILKIFFSGVLIFMTSCYEGLRVQRGLHEVPYRTTQAVVRSLVLVISFQAAVTALTLIEDIL
jgi:phospholipid/cholesterol/gamma-HCH transport system permease protein